MSDSCGGLCLFPCLCLCLYPSSRPCPCLRAGGVVCHCRPLLGLHVGPCPFSAPCLGLCRRLFLSPCRVVTANAMCAFWCRVIWIVFGDLALETEICWGTGPESACDVYGSLLQSRACCVGWCLRCLCLWGRLDDRHGDATCGRLLYVLSPLMSFESFLNDYQASDFGQCGWKSQWRIQSRVGCWWKISIFLE